MISSLAIQFVSDSADEFIALSCIKSIIFAHDFVITPCIDKYRQVQYYDKK